MFRVALLALSVSALAGLGAACDFQPEEICAANGPGIHCHPCVRMAYIVCTSSSEGTVQTCPKGSAWDAYAARCVAAITEPAPCVAGVNVQLPQPSVRHSQLYSSMPNAIHASQSHSWVGWAASSITGLASTAAGELGKSVSWILNTLVPEMTSPAYGTRSSLRSQMLVGPTVEQLQLMQANLAEAADMHSHAVSMSRDAELVKAVAAQDVAAAKALLLSPAGSSSDVAAVAAAVEQAQQLIKRAAAAQETALGMHTTADLLMDQSAAEAAGVSLALTAASQQQQQQQQQGFDSTAPEISGPAFQAAATADEVMMDDDVITDNLITDYHTSYDSGDNGDNDSYDSDMDEYLLAPDSYSDDSADDVSNFSVTYQDEDYSDDYTEDYVIDYGDQSQPDLMTNDLSDSVSESDITSVNIAAVQQERADLLTQIEAMQNPEASSSWAVVCNSHDTSDADAAATTTTSSSSDELADDQVNQYYLDDMFDDEGDAFADFAVFEEDQYSAPDSASEWASPTSNPAEFQDPQLLKDLDSALLQIEQQQQAADRWQQRSRKGLSGRSHIGAAVAEV